MKAGAFTEKRVVELSKSFTCVYVEYGEQRELAAEHMTETFLETVMIAPDGRSLGRYRPKGIYEPGDPKALAAAMEKALTEMKNTTPIPTPRDGAELIGRDAPEWNPDTWLRGDAKELADLKGKVVLMRFFTNTCPFCAASMPALQKLHEKYAKQGLRVVGFYHPKPFGAKRTTASVKKLLDEWGVTFPIALDTRWKTLTAYWLGDKNAKRRATSASFLIGKKGRIRFLHPGPELHAEGGKCNLRPERCHRDYEEMEQAIRTLLAEKTE